jgi:hypothetical protein
VLYGQVLTELLEKIEGAIGVGFVAHDGEAVQLEGQLDDYSHRLHLAYQGILLQNLNQIHSSPKATLRSIIQVYQDYVIVIKPLLGGYFLVLTLQHRKNLPRALRYLQEAAEALNQEL